MRVSTSAEAEARVHRRHKHCWHRALFRPSDRSSRARAHALLFTHTHAYKHLHTQIHTHTHVKAPTHTHTHTRATVAGRRGRARTHTTTCTRTRKSVKVRDVPRRRSVKQRRAYTLYIAAVAAVVDGTQTPLDVRSVCAVGSLAFERRRC